MPNGLVITAVECMTGVGLDAASTTAAVRAGLSRLRASEQFRDRHGSPVVESCIPWLPAEEEEEPDEDEALLSAEPEGLEEDAEDEESAELAEDEETADDEPDGEDEIDRWEVARQLDVVQRVHAAARESLTALLEALGAPASGSALVTLGVPGAWRPGPRFEGPESGIADALLAVARMRLRGAELTPIPTGNASAIRGLAFAAQRVGGASSGLCIVAGIDSLLGNDTLNWYESTERLKSATPGRNHALSPSEAIGFVVVESAQSAQRDGRRVLAEVAGIAVTAEPNPFLSDRPSRAEGLTQACQQALAAAGPVGTRVGAVLADLDGEFHRSKEWALVQSRCFRGAETLPLVHPADCFGSVGAASGAVLVAIAAAGFAQGWFTTPVLVVCSDDAGECGAVVLAPPTTT
jgi:3-oxoacyl-[acyl-carrier-protein] synthase-1